LEKEGGVRGQKGVAAPNAGSSRDSTNPDSAGAQPAVVDRPASKDESGRDELERRRGPRRTSPRYNASYVRTRQTSTSPARPLNESETLRTTWVLAMLGFFLGFVVAVLVVGAPLTAAFALWSTPGEWFETAGFLVCFGSGWR